MTIPTESARDMMTGHGLVARDDVFDSTGEDVAVVRETGGEGWTVVEDVFGFVFGS